MLWKDATQAIVGMAKVYQAPTRAEAEQQLDNFAANWSRKYPLVIKSWKTNWDRLSVYLDYPEQVRKIIYTTNLIKGFKRQLRKVTKNRSIFPNDQALQKLLYLATQDIVKKWTKPLPNWAQTISQLAIHFPDRIKLNLS